jgi:hypothetical protein
MQDFIYPQNEKSILLELLNTDQLIERYEHNLRGEVLVIKKEKDEKGQDTVKQSWDPKFKPKMNDLGVTSTLSFLRVICDKSISMTDLSEDMADMLAMQNADAFWTFLNVNAMNFGLKGESQLNEAYYPIYDLIVSRFHSCIDGMMVNAVAKTTNVSESKTVAPEQQPEQARPGILSMLRPRV